jgi:hypothetical protein
MKPTLLYIAALGVVACAVFTSCEQNNNQGPEHVDSLKYLYSVEYSQELMDYVDIEITYANGKGELITDTLTKDSMQSILLRFEDFDGYARDTTRRSAYWDKMINIDTIPARLYLKSRYLMKPDIIVDNDIMIHFLSEIEMQSPWWKSDSTASFKDYGWEYMKCDPIHSVRGSKLKAYIDLVNEQPPTLDYTLRRDPDDRTEGELVKTEEITQQKR